MVAPQSHSLTMLKARTDVKRDVAIALAPGQKLPVLERQITQETINRYAEASGDKNPLHVDPEFAAATQFGGPIAHGMLVLAYVSEALTTAFGEAWLSSGRLKARFRAAARPGDTITVSGTVTRAEGGRIHSDMQALNQSGEVLISAEAEVTA
jgi:3-hydroxybutyryl-CoA dehydratase